MWPEPRGLSAGTGLRSLLAGRTAWLTQNQCQESVTLNQHRDTQDPTLKWGPHLRGKWR